MHPKEVRRNVLQAIYDSDSRYFFEIKNLEKLTKDVGEKNLDEAIRYLEGHNYLEIMGAFMGQEFLNFHALRITSSGIDLLENPEEVSKLFTVKINHFENISNSNLNIESPYSDQNLKVSELSSEIQKILNDLIIAIQQKDDTKAFNLLSELKEGARDIFWGIVSNILINWPK